MPRSMLRHLPNALTVGRLLLVLPLGWAVLGGRDGMALALAAVAGASDALDGWLARRCGWESVLGAWLDPAADKLLLASGFVALSMVGAVPWWLTLLVLGRDVVIVAGALAYHWLRERLVVAPSRISKLNTGVQIGFLLLVLAGRASGLRAGPALLIWLVAALTLCSGVDYVIRFTLKARRVREQRQ